MQLWRRLYSNRISIATINGLQVTFGYPKCLTPLYTIIVVQRNFKYVHFCDRNLHNFSQQIGDLLKFVIIYQRVFYKTFFIILYLGLYLEHNLYNNVY